MTFANELRDAEMTEIETSVLFQVFALNTARKLFQSNKCFKTALEKLYSDLRFQYTSSNDLALKMGTILLMIGELEVIFEFD
jgi:hypothetical protein